MSARAHLGFDTAIEQAQDKLHAEQDAAEDWFEEAKIQARDTLDLANEALELANQAYDKSVKRHNFAMAAIRLVEEAARAQLKKRYRDARDEYEAEIHTARQAFRAAMERQIEEEE